MNKNIALVSFGVGLAALSACSSTPQMGPSGSSDNSSEPPGPCDWDNCYRTSRVDKIDLLFMIDNSASMLDKQQVLAATVPGLIGTFVYPPCRDINGNTQPRDANNNCPTNASPVFASINNIHIGVVTSSLGGHGADICNAPSSTAHTMDMSHLSDRDGKGGTVPTYVTPDGPTSHFLYWGPDAGAETNFANLIKNFTTIVTGVGQDGCGFEAQLEGWYRFLVDPAPYQSIAQGPCAGNPGVTCANTSGVDTTALQERADFLRQDSLVAIIMMSDENDCSVIDGSQNYLVLEDPGTFAMFKGTTACKANPMSADCKPCYFAPTDPNCSPANYGGKNDPLDAYNLRCYRQKQRFGMDFMWPISRYVNGLTMPFYKNADGSVNYVNPLFCINQSADGKSCNDIVRDTSLVFFAGIVGVPWQDIAAVPASNPDATWWHHDDTGYTLSYLTTTQFLYKPAQYAGDGLQAPGGVSETANIWDIILGKTTATGDIDYSSGAEPLDPLMVESVAPRNGADPITGQPIANPVTGQALAGTSSTTPWANEINGHEWDVGAGQDDLQYACIFELQTSYDGSVNGDCDGANGVPQAQTPVCQNSDGTYGSTQYRAKAYPGRRELAVLKGVGSQGIVASICPKTLDPSRQDYGYSPVIAAIMSRLTDAMGQTCWSAQLTPNANGLVDCTLLEATKTPRNDPNCTCTGTARAVPSAAALEALQSNVDYVNNGLGCACVIEQAGSPGNGGPAQTQACINAATNMLPNVYGWCYVDGQENPTAVAECPPGYKQIIRFAGAPPVSGSLTFMQCSGQ